MAAFLIQSSAGQRGCVGLLRCWSLTVSPRTLITPRCPLHTSRSFYSSAPAKSPTHVEVNQPLKQWALEVSPFCTVRAQLACSISIRPLDLHAFPEADRAFITVHGTDAEQQEVDLDHLRVHYDDQSKELLISAEKVNSNVSIDLAAPIKSNLYINTQGNGNVAVKKMECDICKVQTERGNCLLHSVKGHQVKVQSNGGHVTGAVCVRVPSTLRAGVELRGSSVEISPEMVLHEVENNTTQGQTTVTGYMNGASPVDQWVKAQADRGSVRLRTQSWFESLKLGS